MKKRLTTLDSKDATEKNYRMGRIRTWMDRM